MSFEIAKAGWLYRLSSVLHRWKRNWFVLYTNGMLKYFDTPEGTVAEEAILIPSKCIVIKKATQVTNVTPPHGLDTGCLIALVFNQDTWTMCAESSDDMTSWVMSLEDARVVNRPTRTVSNPPPYSVNVGAAGAQPGYPPAPPGYSAYPLQAGYPQQQVYYGSQAPGTTYVVQPGQPATTIIYADAPYRHHHRHYYRGGGYGYYDGTDVALGMVAGAALGSMMWGPACWW